MPRASGRRGAGKRPHSAATPSSGRRGGPDQRDPSGPGSKAQRHGSAGRTGAGRAGTGRSGPDQARRTACAVLLAVSSNDAYANLLLSASLRERGLHGQDAALATELVYGTLRNRSCYDAVISMCADRDLDQIDPPVLAVLRLGTHQLLGMRIKAHAAVATTVDLAVAVAGRRPAGFVNAVLRRIAPRELESWIELVAPDRATDLAGHLSTRYSHPRWIVEALAAALGESAPGIPQTAPGDGLTAPGQTRAEAGLPQAERGLPQAERGLPQAERGLPPAERGPPPTEAALAADQDRPAVTLAAVPGLARRDQPAPARAHPARWSPLRA